ncbi:MAG: hypothetical protein PHV42_00245 [Candidatus Pacebacteria bacterium]|nr:hypothetical protein [Candidatus Paceibacterota bacterium]
MKLETLAKIASCAIVGEPRGQSSGEPWKRLKAGLDKCTTNHVHWNRPKGWLQGLEAASPEKVIRHMAASVILATMYDLKVRQLNRK